MMDTHRTDPHAASGAEGAHALNKRRLAEFLYRLSESDGAAIDTTLAEFCAPDMHWRIFHPFNDLNGHTEAAARFWAPLRAAMPDWEARMACYIAGEYEGREMVRPGAC